MGRIGTGRIRSTGEGAVGDTFVPVYRTADNPLHAVALVELHCGHFAYRPITQPRIHRQHAHVCAKGQLALEIARGRSPPATQQQAETLRNAIETQADSLGLSALILALRDELALLVTGLVTLQQLEPYGSPGQKIAQADVLGERLRGIRSLSESCCALEEFCLTDLGSSSRK
ncbi:hypothetical protein QFC22_002425 [Naganishia vaughanmartiniae]|uniref:Uncharacterized protein n=1 Tax=Naganishia vaughanmartiniae TaxID=1424756 RepID=A0ACC2XGE9_9TREE|nr:hypothetical protein QFC22_002425 [Naganishia vaughanmartiniae]